MQGKLKIIDIYVTKQFLQMIIFGLIAFILIFILVDLMENLDDFIDQRVSLSIILKYYLYFSPEIIKKNKLKLAATPKFPLLAIIPSGAPTRTKTTHANGIAYFL